MNVFEYTDYRQCLKKYYIEQKSKNPSYSYRVFANRAKLASPNYLKLVIDGKRRVTDKNLPSFIRGLNLDSKEAKYFKNLVFFQEAKDPEAKKNFLHDLIKIQEQNLKSIQELKIEQHEILKKWTHWVIREMVLLNDFKMDAQWVSSRLKYKITPHEAQESLNLLQNLNFIKNNQKKWEQSEPLIASDNDISALLRIELHRQFLELGIKSLDLPKHKRNIQGLTIALSDEEVSQFFNDVKEFQIKMNKKFSQQGEKTNVYHMAINFFPLTKRSESDV